LQTAQTANSADEKIRGNKMADEEGGYGGHGGGRGGDRGERRGMNPNYFLPKPVKVGDVLEVTIEGSASRGDGIAKKDGFVIFVKGAKPGDKLTVKVTDVRTRFAIGEPVTA
jgi:predicted RNA-binding protein with TRAM domain